MFSNVTPGEKVWHMQFGQGTVMGPAAKIGKFNVAFKRGVFVFDSTGRLSPSDEQPTLFKKEMRAVEKKIEIPRKPQGVPYFAIVIENGYFQVDSTNEWGTSLDLDRSKSGNYFDTYEEAKEFCNKLMALLNERTGPVVTYESVK